MTLMRNSLIVVAVILLLIALGAGAIYYLYKNQVFETKVEPSPSPTAVEKFPSSQTATPSAQPASGVSDNDNYRFEIKLTSPRAYSFLSSPAQITGDANAPEQLLILIKDTNDNILGQSQASACTDPEPCTFSASILFTTSPTANGTVEVYSLAQKPTQEESLQAIPVRFF